MGALVLGMALFGLAACKVKSQSCRTLMVGS